jgi:hypothetical protein
MNVAGAELPYTNLLQSSTQGVAGQQFYEGFPGAIKRTVRMLPS